VQARLNKDLNEKPGLTRFLPARLSDDGVDVTPLPWKGSSDVATLARADCFLVVEADRGTYASGELIRIVMKSQSS
jgi:molybdopterin molybdotransferase